MSGRSSCSRAAMMAILGIYGNFGSYYAARKQQVPRLRRILRFAEDSTSLGMTELIYLHKARLKPRPFKAESRGTAKAVPFQSKVKAQSRVAIFAEPLHRAAERVIYRDHL